MPPVSNRSAIEAAIKAKLEAIPGVVNVYTHRQRLEDVVSIIDNFLTPDNKIQGWWISRVATDPHVAESNYGQIDLRTGLHYYHTFAVEMFLGYQNDDPNTGDGTEDSAQTLADTVLDAFAEERTLGAWNSMKPLSLMQIGFNSLGVVEGFTARFAITLIDYQSGLSPH